VNESLTPFNIEEWIAANRGAFQPPLKSKTLYEDPQLLIMVVGGPNQRGDFHVTDSPEFFWQLEGSMVIEYMESGERKRVTVGPGEVAMIPAMVPHSPQRPAETIGLIVERRRRPDEPDGFHWYCNNCNNKLSEASKWDGRVLKTARECFEEFENDESRRTCSRCGQVQPVGAAPRV
jgi:3-hydroxyanthranilate 3,4-dioxygenase